MANATFYIVSEQSPQASETGFDAYVIFLSRHFANQGAKVYLNCQDQSHAERLAELFWQAEPEQFIAHNLVGEGPKYGTNIEIGHQNVKPNWNRQIAINLADNNTTFAQQFSEVVDFVPCEENAKQQARNRYKIYRQSGFNLQTIEIQHP
ncbi:DNA polymerase III subunit chi [uncultured Vibrio sp.]|uniref:DNA polymerase III subunit chi n=1 Tax=uncultured Vibrio sp. TaxID=114054 RepID=UPI0009210B75|nr:DNA polymerase III subunit chi [uncultured Vibrio sp.]OIQ24218.1 MAG: DNA polymerase III subunit chi [Vibrio sp. MedPE-SWchi]